MLCYYFDWISKPDSIFYCPIRERKLLVKYFLAYQAFFKAGNQKLRVSNFLFFVNWSLPNGSYWTGVTKYNLMDIPGRRQIKFPRLSNSCISVVHDRRSRNTAQLPMTNAIHIQSCFLSKYSQYMLLAFISGPTVIIA